MLFFKNLSMQRAFWLLLTFSAFAFEGCALYFQYGLGLNPCVLCVYERLAVLGLALAGVIGAIMPRVLIIRFAALMLGLFSAIKGLLISLRHLDLQMYPAPWKQCEFLPNFPETLPFHHWFPFLFKPTGSCNESQWSLFGVTMVQWLVVIFALYSLVLLILTISQFKRSPTRHYFR